MSTPSASRAEEAPRRILVWDAPVRVFHWLAVLCFAGAWLTSEGERWALLHVTFGYTLAGLVAFRLLWGLVGTRYARFADFVRGPAAVGRYFGSLLRGRPEHHVGHNPAGALGIVALLVLAVVVTLTGWATYGDLGGDWLEELHEGAATLMLFVVGVHVAGGRASSRLHRENLVGAMIDGRKLGRAVDGIRRAWRGLALAMVLAVLGFWAWQWLTAPEPGTLAATRHERGHD